MAFCNTPELAMSLASVFTKCPFYIWLIFEEANKYPHTNFD